MVVMIEHLRTGAKRSRIKAELSFAKSGQKCFRFKKTQCPSFASAREAVIKKSVVAPNRIRVLVAKPGLDGHDRGAKVIARALRDAGMEVIYTGLRQTPEMIVNAALQEDVQVIGVSILSGAHNSIIPEIIHLLNLKRMEDVMVIVGGTIPDADATKLKALGVAEVFQPGASLDSIVSFIRSRVVVPATE